MGCCAINDVVVVLSVIALWQVDAVGHLLSGGANPGVVDKNGAAPLVYAIQQGHTEIAKMLLNAGQFLSSRGP